MVVFLWKAVPADVFQSKSRVVYGSVHLRISSAHLYFVIKVYSCLARYGGGEKLAERQQLLIIDNALVKCACLGVAKVEASFKRD